METPDILAIFEGRLLVPSFRGRNKQLLVRTDEGALEPLEWFDKSLYVPEGEERPMEVPPELDGVNYQFDSRIFRDILEQTFHARQNLQTVLLINSFGGKLGSEVLMEQVVQCTHEREGKVHAYASTVAVSAGSTIMQKADEIHLLEDTWCMWHLPDFGANYRDYIMQHWGEQECDAVIDRHNRQRHRIHLEKLEGLMSRAFLEAQPYIRSEIDRVMNLSNVRHELSFTGAELAQFGVAKQAHPSFDSLAQAIQDTHGITAKESDWQTDPISRFFLFSRIEEQMRARFGINVKIIQVQDEFYLQYPEQLEEQFTAHSNEMLAMVIQEIAALETRSS